MSLCEAEVQDRSHWVKVKGDASAIEYSIRSRVEERGLRLGGGLVIEEPWGCWVMKGLIAGLFGRGGEWDGEIVDKGLYKHQVEAVRRGLGAWLGRGVLKIPTGGGKTRIAGEIVRRGEWVYVVHGVSLVEQAKEKLDAEVVSWEGLGAMRKRRLDGVIVDECHQITWRRLKMALGVEAERWIGMSATPFDRGSGNDIVMALVGDVVYEVDEQTLVDAGVIVRKEHMNG